MVSLPTNQIADLRSDPFISEYQTRLTPTDDTLNNLGGGRGYKVYDEIRREPHAYALLQKRKLEVTSREWDVTAASDRRLDKRAAEEVKRQLKAIDFDRLTKGLMGAVLKGFAVGEIIWSVDAGVWTAREVKVKKQRRFRFDLDGQLYYLTRAQPSDGEKAPDRKFIVHRHSIDDDDDDPYGVGLGSVLYWPAWFKRQALAHWLRSIEKSADPTLKLSYQGSYDEKKTQELIDAWLKAARDKALVVPENTSAELLQKSGSVSDDFEALNRYLDELMSEATLGETLTTNSGERGARSLGEVHNEIRVAIAKADSDLVSQTIMSTLVKWIVDLNFPGAGYPAVWRNFEESEDLTTKIGRDKIIFDLGYEPEDPDYISETYGGSWIKKKEPAPADPIAPPADGGRKAVAALFKDTPVAEPTGVDAVAETLGSQLMVLAAPAVDRMIEAVRTEVMAATSFDNLIERLAFVSAEHDIADLAGLLEQAMTLAQLQGTASVEDDQNGG
jgi:phage gp29-like protein